MSKHVQTTARREGRRLPRRLRALSVIGTCGLLAAGSLVLAPDSSATTRPQRVLQAVSIDLGTDGSITGIASDEVRRDAASTKGSDTSLRRVDPNKVDGQLPVRVSLSYVHDGRTGTDLKDIAGASGHVELDVTVTNLTAHPEAFTVQNGATGHTTYALVSTPLTVVASATLPAGSFARVTQPSATSSDSDATNGVVSRASSGDTTVQWASLLAPPRLGSSTTFRLVEDATSFHVPHLDLSVQPGLVTDPSVSQLLGQAFGSDVVSVEQSTIQLIAGVNDQLAVATKNLRDIGTSLTTNATGIGTAAAERVTATTQQLASTTTQLSSALATLDATVSNGVSSSSTKSLVSLRAAVSHLQSYIGRVPDAAALQPPPVQQSGGCLLPGLDSAVPTTLFGQLVAVRDQLSLLSSASAYCSAQVRLSLEQSIGSVGDCPAGTASEDVSLVCRLTGVQDQLTAVDHQLVSTTSTLLKDFDPAITTAVGTAVGDLLGSVATIQRTSGSLDLDGSFATLTGRLADLAGQVGTLAAVTGPEGAVGTVGDLSFANLFGDINKLATSQAAAVDGDRGSVSGQVQALASSLCDVPTPAPSATPDAAYQAYVDRLRSLVSGTACADPSAGPSASASPLPLPDGYPTPLADRVADDAAQWRKVAALTDASNPSAGSPVALVAALHSSLQGITFQLKDVQSKIGDGSSTASLQGQVDQVVGSISSLYDPKATAPSCTQLSGSTAPVNKLQNTYAALSCNTSTLHGDLAAVQAAVPAVSALSGSISAAQSYSTAQAARAGDLLGGLTDALSGRLTADGQQVIGNGVRVVKDQQGKVSTQAALAAAALGAGAKTAISTLGTSVTMNDAAQKATSAQLQQQLQLVQGDLGTGKDTKGLLGVVRSSAGLTAVNTQQVTEAGQQASTFGGVRGADVLQSQLVDQQVERARAAAAAAPPFDLQLPPGSTDSVVYVLHVRAF